MKVEVEIPDQYEGRDIWIFAGIEPIFRRYWHRGFWERKVSQCSRCGTCCKSIKEPHPLALKEGGCKHLLDQQSEFLCGMSYFRPFCCCVGELDLKQCTVKWEPIK